MKLIQKQDFFESCELLKSREQVGVIGRKLLLEIMELAMHENVDNSKLNDATDIPSVQVEDFGGRIITIPLKEIIKDSDSISTVQDAIRAMQRDLIKYKTNDGAWASSSLFNKVVIHEGRITLRIEPELWSMFVDLQNRKTIQNIVHQQLTYSHP